MAVEVLRRIARKLARPRTTAIHIKETDTRTTPPFSATGLSQLCYARKGRSCRVSSWDRTGGNRDYVTLESGEIFSLAEFQGAGCIRHLWITARTTEVHYLRRLLLRAYWDSETEPSVESPLGDFFGVGHATVSNYWSQSLNMVTGGEPERKNLAAMNCFFRCPSPAGSDHD